ncbi:DNA translocase FtsK [bacterium]|nr:DNA translocase FtsK [bacterium]
MDDPFSTDRLNDVADFRPAWDVPTLGAAFTTAFSAAIDDVRARPAPDPGRKIHAFLGPAGYGKTHLFGRIHHHQRDRVYFAFIPALSGIDSGDRAKRLESTLRWRLVESLLYAAHTFAPLRLQFARLLAPSFAAYFDQLSAGLKARSAAVRGALEQDPLTVLELFAQVDGLGPYHQLADAVRARLPHCSGPVLRALVLGVSPAADDARWWLRGEADQVPERRLAALRLTDRSGQPLDSPPLIDVLRAVAELLRLNDTPLVVCFDQLEELFKHERSGSTALTGQLMTWLHEVPNLLVGVGCHTDLWRHVAAEAGFKSFFDRVTSHHLPPLSGTEAAELVRRRMASWADYDAKREPGWPFDLDSARAYADRNEPAPRSFLQLECAPRFNDWLAKKRAGVIRFDSGPVETPVAELFRLEWAKELGAVAAERKAAADTQDTDLWAAVEESLTIAGLGGYVPAGVRIDSVGRQPIAPSPSDPRPSARVTLSAGGKTRSVIVAVSKKDGGGAFGHWYTALEAALTGTAAGAVVVWPRAQLAVGKTTGGYRKYAEKLASGAIRPFPLDENEAAFHQLECLRRVILSAKTGNLLLGKTSVTADDCRKLIVEAGLLANLKLYEFVFRNWPGLTESTTPAVAPPPASAPPPAPPPTAPPPPASVGASRPTPVSPPPPSAPLQPPAAEPTWAETILKKAADYLKKRGQPVHPVGADVGPTFVRLKVELRGDADFGRIKKQEKNLKLNLLLPHEPLIQAQAGYVSIDVQRPDRQTVLLSSLLPACPTGLAGEPAFPVGVGVDGTVEWLNLSEPEGCHVLVAGTTGSGKSEFLKAAVAALAARLDPTRLRFRLVDPKRVTFNVDPRCPYLGGPVVYDAEAAIPVLEECSDEMERRYERLQARGKDHVRQLTGADAVPWWVVVFDEFADLMTDKGTRKLLEPLLKRLGAKARAAGIHLVLGTQRPDATVLPLQLRSNLPGRVGLQVATERESKLFLDEPDAAYLFGKGDLVWKRGGGLVRLQSPFAPRAEFDDYLRVGRG